MQWYYVSIVTMKVHVSQFNLPKLNVYAGKQCSLEEWKNGLRPL